MLTEEKLLYFAFSFCNVYLVCSMYAFFEPLRTLYITLNSKTETAKGCAGCQFLFNKILTSLIIS